jgi:hypothetical protein
MILILLFARQRKKTLTFLSVSFIVALLLVYSYEVTRLWQLDAFRPVCDCKISASDGAPPVPRTKDVALQHVWTQVTFSVEFEKELVSHKMQHLQDLGLDMSNALIIIHQQNITEELEDVVHTVEYFGVPQAHIHVWDGIFTAQRKYEQRLMARDKAGVDECDWIINLDGDEFPRAPGNDLVSFLEMVGYQGFDALNSYWLDRFGPGGSLPNVTDNPEISKQLPVTCRDFTDRVTHAPTFKLFAFRAYLQEYNGGSHTLLDGSIACQYPSHILMDHYKWNWEVLNKLQRRASQYKQLGLQWFGDSLRFLDHFESHNGTADVNYRKFRCQDAENTSFVPVLDEAYSNKKRKTREGLHFNMKQNQKKVNGCGRQYKICPNKLHKTTNEV